MDTHKLKVKIGHHEFEAEGSQEAVEKQFEAFKSMVKELDNKPSSDHLKDTGTLGAKSELKANGEEIRLESIIKVEGDKISLTAHPSGEDPQAEAVLLILLGHKVLRGTEQVSGINC